MPTIDTTSGDTPAALGFSMPAEWETHEATWLAWPHNPTDWPDKLDTIRWVYGEMVRKICPGRDRPHARQLQARGETGPPLPDPRRRGCWAASSSSCIRPTAAGRATAARSLSRAQQSAPARPSKPRIVHFHFNAWAKYPDWRKTAACRRPPPSASGKRLFHAAIQGRDVRARRRRHRGQRPRHAAHHRGVLSAIPKVQVRNPGLGRKEFEETLRRYLGVTNVFWLGRRRGRRRHPRPHR